MKLLFGDIHDHCGISYGYGSLENALKNALSHLDFVAVTGHAFRCISVIFFSVYNDFHFTSFSPLPWGQGDINLCP